MKKALPHNGDFYPRPPCGGRRSSGLAEHKAGIFLSTPSVRRATRPPHVRRPAPSISIHALRAEGDQHYANMITQDEISIHALRAEGDAASYWMRTHGNDFYPRPPCGGRRYKSSSANPVLSFLSTPSVRRATSGSGSASTCRPISIHALRAEGDLPLRLGSFP